MLSTSKKQKHENMQTLQICFVQLINQKHFTKIMSKNNSKNPQQAQQKPIKNESGDIEMVEMNKYSQPVHKVQAPSVDNNDGRNQNYLQQQQSAQQQQTGLVRNNQQQHPQQQQRSSQNQNQVRTQNQNRNFNNNKNYLTQGIARQQQQLQPRKSGIPQMDVSCQYCTVKQSVPGNTQVYACCVCNQMNQCSPLYGLFVCGHCQRKVCYPYGTSQMIRCTNCKTINKVPTEPKKRYTAKVDPNMKKQGVFSDFRKQEEENQRFQRELNMAIEQSKIEQEKVMQNKEEQRYFLQKDEEKIDFDDVPSAKSNQEDRNFHYPEV